MKSTKGQVTPIAFTLIKSNIQSPFSFLPINLFSIIIMFLTKNINTTFIPYCPFRHTPCTFVDTPNQHMSIRHSICSHLSWNVSSSKPFHFGQANSNDTQSAKLLSFDECPPPQQATQLPLSVVSPSIRARLCTLYIVARCGQGMSSKMSVVAVWLFILLFPFVTMFFHSAFTLFGLLLCFFLIDNFVVAIRSTICLTQVSTPTASLAHLCDQGHTPAVGS